MPELWKNLAALAVHLLDDFFPACQCCFSMKGRDIFSHRGNRIINRSSLGNDQTGTARCSALVISCDVIVRYSLRGELTSHRSHDNAIFECKLVQRIGAKKTV